MNKIILIGRLTKEPELRHTTSNIEVTQFSLAVNRDFKNQGGEYEADFINCVAYRNLAETISKYVKKGDKLGVDGRLQTRTYENSEGKKVYVTEVLVNGIEFLEPRKQETNADVKGGSYTTEAIDEMPIENDPFSTQLQLEDDVDVPW